MKQWTVLKALRYRNFRLFFFGQSISLIGTWMQQVAMIWLVYRLSNSAFLLGLVGFCSQVPILLFSAVAGVFTDRWNLRRTILVTQSLAMLQAAILVALTLTGAVAVWQVILLSILLGLVNAFDMPARQAFLIQMVEDRENLTSAIGLNSSMFNGARLIGPAIAGFLIAAAGEWLCFLINALSYLTVLMALVAIRVAEPVRAKPPQRVLQELKEGFLYAFGFLPIRWLLMLLAVVSLAAMPLLVLMPVFATEVLHGGPDTLGLLTASMGLGALAGALLLAFRKTVLGLGRQIAWASGAFGLGIIAFSLSRFLAISLALLAVSGFAMMMETAATNTILQTILEEDKRGRVMSFYATAFVGMAPLGSLLAGSLASHIGAVHTVQLAGAICLVGSLFFTRQLPALRTIVRPIYRQMGILPQGTFGVPSAAGTPLEPS
jgi:MFS family permease